jgi:hypothetical protein
VDDIMMIVRYLATKTAGPVPFTKNQHGAFPSFDFSLISPPEEKEKIKIREEI